MRGCLHWVSLWACLWMIALIMFINVRRHSPPWAALFPRQGVLNCLRWKNWAEHKPKSKWAWKQPAIALSSWLWPWYDQLFKVPALTSKLLTVTWNCEIKQTLLSCFLLGHLSQQKKWNQDWWAGKLRQQRRGGRGYFRYVVWKVKFWQIPRWREWGSNVRIWGRGYGMRC